MIALNGIITRVPQVDLKFLGGFVFSSDFFGGMRGIIPQSPLAYRKHTMLRRLADRDRCQAKRIGRIRQQTIGAWVFCLSAFVHSSSFANPSQHFDSSLLSLVQLRFLD